MQHRPFCFVSAVRLHYPHGFWQPCVSIGCTQLTETMFPVRSRQTGGQRHTQPRGRWVSLPLRSTESRHPGREDSLHSTSAFVWLNVKRFLTSVITKIEPEGGALFDINTNIGSFVVVFFSRKWSNIAVCFYVYVSINSISHGPQGFAGLLVSAQPKRRVHERVEGWRRVQKYL